MPPLPLLPSPPRVHRHSPAKAAAACHHYHHYHRPHQYTDAPQPKLGSVAPHTSTPSTPSEAQVQVQTTTGFMKVTIVCADHGPGRLHGRQGKKAKSCLAPLPAKNNRLAKQHDYQKRSVIRSVTNTRGRSGAQARLNAVHISLTNVQGPRLGRTWPFIRNGKKKKMRGRSGKKTGQTQESYLNLDSSCPSTYVSCFRSTRYYPLFNPSLWSLRYPRTKRAIYSCIPLPYESYYYVLSKINWKSKNKMEKKSKKGENKTDKHVPYCSHMPCRLNSTSSSSCENQKKKKNPEHRKNPNECGPLLPRCCHALQHTTEDRILSSSHLSPVHSILPTLLQVPCCFFCCGPTHFSRLLSAFLSTQAHPKVVTHRVESLRLSSNEDLLVRTVCRTPKRLRSKTGTKRNPADNPHVAQTPDGSRYPDHIDPSLP